MRKKLQTKTTKCWHASFTVRSNSGESWCVCVPVCERLQPSENVRLVFNKDLSSSPSYTMENRPRNQSLRDQGHRSVQESYGGAAPFRSKSDDDSRWMGFLKNKAGPNSHANGFLKNTKLKTKGRPKGRFALLHKLYLCGKGFCMFILTRICHCTQI